MKEKRGNKLVRERERERIRGKQTSRRRSKLTDKENGTRKNSKIKAKLSNQ